VAWFKSLVGLRDPLLVHSREKNSRDPIAAGGEQRREISCPFRAAGLTSTHDRPIFRGGEAAVQGIQCRQSVTGPPAGAVEEGLLWPIASEQDPAFRQRSLSVDDHQVEPARILVLARRKHD